MLDVLQARARFLQVLNIRFHGPNNLSEDDHGPSRTSLDHDRLNPGDTFALLVKPRRHVVTHLFRDSQD